MVEPSRSRCASSAGARLSRLWLRLLLAALALLLVALAVTGVF